VLQFWHGDGDSAVASLRSTLRPNAPILAVVAVLVGAFGSFVWLLGSRIPLFMERFSTTLTNGDAEKSPDAIVRVAYAHFVREPLPTYARDEVQRRNGLTVKDELIPIGEAVLARVRQYADTSPFIITSVVVGNVQYPAEVANAVSRKLAATQELERKERTKREVQAAGIANAMQIIRGQLSALYIQHEAIEAQKLMVNSPNHTTVYIPVGPMGVPLTGVLPAPSSPAPTRVASSEP
jgi:regulator of protease activity HflC (stomatin/prohibitin superfamily)